MKAAIRRKKAQQACIHHYSPLPLFCTAGLAGFASYVFRMSSSLLCSISRLNMLLSLSLWVFLSWLKIARETRKYDIQIRKRQCWLLFQKVSNEWRVLGSSKVFVPVTCSLQEQTWRSRDVGNLCYAEFEVIVSLVRTWLLSPKFQNFRGLWNTWRGSKE